MYNTVSGLSDNTAPNNDDIMKYQKLFDPWIQSCLFLVHTTDSMDRHMEQAARIYDIHDLVELVAGRYRELILEAVEIVCSTSVGLPDFSGVAHTLDELSKATVMWPASWPRWLVSNYMRESVIVPCMHMSAQRMYIMRELNKMQIKAALYPHINTLIYEPRSFLKDLLATQSKIAPEAVCLYERCCNQWLYLVKEGMSEGAAGDRVMAWFRDGAIAPISLEADLDSILGHTPPDMPMDGPKGA